MSGVEHLPSYELSQQGKRALAADPATLAAWADEHLFDILFRLQEAEYKVDRVEHACDTWDWEPVWSDSLREILGLPMSDAEQTTT